VTEVNGLDTAAMKEAFDVVSGTEGARHAPKSSRVRWLGGFKLRAYIRNHTFEVDEPSHLTGEDLAPNAVEYVLGALGACYLTGFVLNASMRGIELYNVEVTVDATQDNVFTFLGIEPAGNGHSGFDGITARLYVQADAGREALEQVWQQTVATSPVGNSLSRPVPIKGELVVVD
jgi:uncharacterized OsmC-like protein